MKINAYIHKSYILKSTKLTDMKLKNNLIFHQYAQKIQGFSWIINFQHIYLLKFGKSDKKIYVEISCN